MQGRRSAMAGLLNTVEVSTFILGKKKLKICHLLLMKGTAEKRSAGETHIDELPV